MAGLGKRGQDKVGGANELFRKTEHMESAKDINTENPNPVKKSFVLSFELAERLREYAFRLRRKEVDIVREALDDYFIKQGLKKDEL